MLNNSNVIEALSTRSTLPKAAHYDFLLHGQLSRQAEKKATRSTGHNRRCHIESTTYTKPLTLFDLDRRLTTIETKPAAMHPNIRVTAPALPRQPQSNRRLRPATHGSDLPARFRVPLGPLDVVELSVVTPVRPDL